MICRPSSEHPHRALKAAWHKSVHSAQPRQAFTNYSRGLAVFLSLILAGCVPGCKSHPQPEGFVLLFDGKTFHGWEGETNRTFRIQQGAIIGGSLTQPILRNEFLCTTRYFTNFELRLKCKLTGGPDANGGIQFRSRRVPNDSEVSGYQADMAEYQGQFWWGCLYDESRRKEMLARSDGDAVKRVLRSGDWNDYVIRCEGKRVRLWLNGLQTVDFTEPDDRVEDFGIIGLQIHRGSRSEAAYKGIVIQELP
jgi:hypothetical protein